MEAGRPSCFYQLFKGNNTTGLPRTRIRSSCSLHDLERGAAKLLSRQKGSTIGNNILTKRERIALCGTSLCLQRKCSHDQPNRGRDTSRRDRNGSRARVVCARRLGARLGQLNRLEVDARVLARRLVIWLKKTTNPGLRISQRTEVKLGPDRARGTGQDS